MALSQDIKSQFAKAMTPKKEPVEKTVNGTFKIINGKEYVQLDGSDILTPVKSTVVADTGDRVSVLIKNHDALVNGNITFPAARGKDLDNMKDEMDEFGNTIKMLDNNIQLQENSIKMINTNIQTMDATIQIHESTIQSQGSSILALDSSIATINSQISTINSDISAQGSKIESIDDTIKSHGNSIDSFNNTIVEVNNKFQAYDNAIEQMGNDIKQFNNTINEQNSQITAIDTKVQAYDSTLISLGSDIVILNSAFQIVDGKLTGLSEAVIESLKTGSLNAEYATIDFSNIGEAAVEKLFAESGIIKDLVMSEGQVTGELIGVVIKGDLIEANTIRADSLVIRGEDGLYYRLNHTGETVEAQQTDQNSLNGELIAAKTITANKIAVDDLVAFGATIGKFIIGQEALYSTGKGNVDATTPGIYLGSDGQMCVGDDKNAIKFYKDENGNWKLGIRADTLQFGADGISVEYAMGSMTTTIQNSGGSNLLRNSVGYAGTDFWTRSNTSKVITTYQDELMSLSGSKFIITGTQSMSQKYNTEIGASYMLSCKVKHERVGSGGNLKIEIKDSTGNNNGIVIYDSNEVLTDWTPISLNDPYVASVAQPELVITVDGSDVVEITDLIICNGDLRVWSSYFDELYGSGHRLDGKGLKFYNTKTNQESNYTISGLEFSENGNPIAGMSAEKMYSRKSEVSNEQVIGRLRTVVLDSNNIIEYV